MLIRSKYNLPEFSQSTQALRNEPPAAPASGFGGRRLACLAAALVALAAGSTAADVLVGEPARQEARQRNIPVFFQAPNGGPVELQRLSNGQPFYYATDNVNAARSTRTDLVQLAPPLGYSLDGSGVTLGIWDGGGVLVGHNELKGASINGPGAFQIDFVSQQLGISFHATHVAGTMIAGDRGQAALVDPNAKGMASRARLHCFDWNNDEVEMRQNAATGLRISNHSYGYITGWWLRAFVQGNAIYYWFGDINIRDANDRASEDAYFGYYSFQARDWDQISFNNPRYLWVKSAGNDRNDGPGDFNLFTFYYDPSDPFANIEGFVNYLDSDTVQPPAPYDGWHLAPISFGMPEGYDCISHGSTAKNGLIVGAVNDVPDYTGPSAVAMSNFSGWGPTDDGRIKPDICGNGVDVYSSFVAFDAQGNVLQNVTDTYAELSGTSMASPNVSGSLGLLLQHYRATHAGAEDLLSATMKALVIHTADECGSAPGPDYRFGWGLMNTQRAADVITQDATSPLVISEATVAECYPEVIYNLTVDGTASELRATICWTDRPPTEAVMPPDPVRINPDNKALVNDLDLRIFRESDSQEFRPWALSLAAPTAPAAKADNSVDNVEQVVITSPPAGAYRLVVKSKGLFEGVAQSFGMIITGASQVRRETKPPLLTGQTPNPGITLGSLATVAVSFDECARNVKPADMKINGRPATSVSGSGAGPYLFTFDNPGNGDVNIELVGGSIVDFADNPFPGAAWSYRIKDCNGNRIIDDVDIANGLLEDCNVNLVPDICDPDTLKAAVGPDRAIEMEDEIILGESTYSAVGGVPPYTYEWTLRGHDGDEFSSEAQPVFHPKDPGTYVVRLVVTDSKACSSIAYLTIDVAGDVPPGTTPPPTNEPDSPDAGGGAGLCGAGTAMAMLTGLASLVGFRRIRRRRQ